MHWHCRNVGDDKINQVRRPAIISWFWMNSSSWWVRSNACVGRVTQTYIFDHYIFDILGKAELPFQSERNWFCFRQLLRTCARVPCLEQRRLAGDLGVTHYCWNDGVGSTSHMSWMRNLMWRWSSLHRSGLFALIQVPCGVTPFQASPLLLLCHHASSLMISFWKGS